MTYKSDAKYGLVAQLVVRMTVYHEVVGSCPIEVATVVSTAITSMFRWKSGPGI